MARKRIPKSRRRAPSTGVAIASSSLDFTGERIVPEADNCEPNFASRMYQEHIARYLFAGQIVQGKSVIDIGCGVGYGSRRLAELGATSVHAFDVSEDAIRHARLHYGHPSVHFQTANAEQFTTDSKFDVAVCFELIEHVRNPRKVLKNIKNLLHEDAILVMSTPRALERKRTHFHEHEFSLEEYHKLLREYFNNVDMYVENNHFSSLITKGCPTHIGDIECLKSQFDSSMADVFIAVATSSSTSIPLLRPALAIDDDAYVTMLERDVEILHRAEDELKEKFDATQVKYIEQVEDTNREIDRLKREYKTLFDKSEDLSTRLWEAEQNKLQIASREDEIAQLTNDYNALFEESEQLKTSLWEAEQRQSEAASKDAEIARLTREYNSLFAHSEELSTRLGKAEQRNSELDRQQTEIDRLTSECKVLRERASDLSKLLQESEMNHAELQQEQKKLRGELELLTVRSADADARRLEAYEFARVASDQANGLRRELEILRRDIADALDRPSAMSQSQEAHCDQRHRDVVKSMERLFLGTDATHAIARDPVIDRILALSTELREHRERALHLSREIVALQEFQREAEDWHRQLLRIRRSVSWRITAPIRALTRPFRQK